EGGRINNRRERIAFLRRSAFGIFIIFLLMKLSRAAFLAFVCLSLSLACDAGETRNYPEYRSETNLVYSTVDGGLVARRPGQRRVWAVGRFSCTVDWQSSPFNIVWAGQAVFRKTSAI